LNRVHNQGRYIILGAPPPSTKGEEGSKEKTEGAAVGRREGEAEAPALRIAKRSESIMNNEKEDDRENKKVELYVPALGCDPT
jgi:hypothetical protein